MTIHRFLNDISISDSLMSITSEIVLKTLLVALLAYLAIQLLHRKSAALRHLVCLSALVAVLLIPIGVTTLPSWNLLPAFSSNVQDAPKDLKSSSISKNTSVTSDGKPVSELMDTAAAMPSNSPGTAGNKLVERPASWSVPTWGALLAMLWVVPSLFFLLNICRGMVLLQLRSQRAQSNDNERIAQLSEELASSIGISLPNIFIEKHQQSLPMVWGIVQGRLYLPANAHQWPEQKLRDVLLHEFAHLKRRDPLTLLLGQIARAVYWFNPLIWMLNRQMVMEQEVACDDQVLRYSTDRAGYASTLLEMTAISQPSSAGSSISAAMAKPLQIERRIRYLLDKKQNRAPMKLTLTVATLVLFLCMAGFVSCLTASHTEIAERVTAGQEPEAAEPNENLVAAVEFLQNVQDENDQFAESDSMADGTNALGAIALTYVGELADKENQARAIRKVADQDFKTTYELSLQLIALCYSGDKAHEEKINACVKRLCEFQVKAGVGAGGWSYVRSANRADGSNTRFAVWALAIAHQSGYKIPEPSIELSAEYWVNGQHDSGGWGYVHNAFNQPTATMNLSGIACLSWLRPMLEDDHPLQEKMAAGIVKAWSIENLGEQIENESSWPYYGLHIYALAAEATDRELDGLDTQVLPTREHLHELLAKRQKDDGSYGDRDGNFKSICTSLAILSFEKP